MSSAQSNTFARRNCDGLAQIGPTRFDIIGARFFTDDQGAAGAGGDGTDGQQANVGQQGSDAPWTKENFDPDRAWNLVQNLRTEVTDTKSRQEQAITAAVAKAVADAQTAWTQQIATALGGGDKPETDPAKLQASVADLTTKLGEKDNALSAAQAQAKAGAVATAVAIHAPGLGANTALLLGNEQFKNSIASVEPTDEAAIKAAITKALQENAALKQPPARSGAGEYTGPTVQSLEAQLKAAQDAGDQTEVIRLTRAVVHARSSQQA